MWLWWVVRNNTQCCLHCAFVVRISNFLFVLQLVGLHGGLFAHSVLDLFFPPYMHLCLVTQKLKLE